MFNYFFSLKRKNKQEFYENEEFFFSYWFDNSTATEENKHKIFVYFFLNLICTSLNTKYFPLFFSTDKRWGHVNCAIAIMLWCANNSKQLLFGISSSVFIFVFKFISQIKHRIYVFSNETEHFILFIFFFRLIKIAITEHAWISYCKHTRLFRLATMKECLNVKWNVWIIFSWEKKKTGKQFLIGKIQFSSK